MNYNYNDHIFVTSDLHFSHINCIKYCNRPFSSIEEMDQTIINNWNNKVEQNDLVFIIGDIIYGVNKKKYLETLKSYIFQLNGTIKLIPGNHDRIDDIINYTGWNGKLEVINNYIYEYNAYYLSKTIIMSHYPLLRWPRMARGSWHLYGHVHNNEHFDHGLSYNVGVDDNNFTPLTLTEIKEIMIKKDQSTLLK